MDEKKSNESLAISGMNMLPLEKAELSLDGLSAGYNEACNHPENLN